MKKFKDIVEQHREVGRFKPVKPHNVSSVAAASPRATSDSANVKLKEDLRKWFSKTDPAGDWKRINSKGEAIGPCAREPGEPKPKCMSKEKRAKLSKKERASAVAAKRRHDPNPERKGEPINVSNFGKGKISEEMENLEEKNVPTSPEKWAQAKAQAKAKFDVYPSAYANGWASKKYKEMGGGWKSVSEESEQIDEISQDLAGKYLEKVAHDQTKKVGLKSNLYNKLEPKRQKGVDRALDRMAVKEDNADTPAKESLMKRSEKPVAYVHEGAFKRIATDREEDERLAKQKGSWKVETPWKKSPGTVTDKSGAKHTPMSRARDLARKAFHEQSNVKPNPFTIPSTNPGQAPEKKKTRQSAIIREAMKAGKDKMKQKQVSTGTADKFIEDPELSSKITKN